MSITEKYCSFEVSKLLKEKGFNVENTIGYYQISKMRGEAKESPKLHIDIYHLQRHPKGSIVSLNWNAFEDKTSATTHEIAIEWIRQKFGLFISTEFNNTNLMYYYVIHTNVSKQHSNRINSLPETFLEPFSATEAALKIALKNIIK